MQVAKISMLLTCLALAIASQAQTPTVPSQNAAGVTNTKKYPFQQALRILQGQQRSAPVMPSISMASSGPVYLHRTEPTGVTRRLIDPPLPTVPLSISAQQALAIAQKENSADAMPTLGPGGRVTYTYGQGLPTIVCAPLHVCIIELEPGEIINGEPAIGDSIRWEIMPGVSGSGADAQPLVMVKPHESGLDTDLVITTNKRTYFLRLVSRPHEYMAKTAFSYKEDEARAWKAFVAQEQAEQQARQQAQVITPVANDAIDHLYFDYEIKGGNAIIRPIRVMDDGEKTYITMPDAVLHQDLPALVVLNPHLRGESAEEIVNYRVKGNLYIVDRLFDEAALVLGSGKGTEKVIIKRRQPLSAMSYNDGGGE